MATIKTKEPFTLVRSVALLKLKKDMVVPAYGEHFLRTRYAQSQILRGSKKSSQANIFLGPIKSLMIQVLPLELQEQFSQIVEKYDSFQRSQLESSNNIDILFKSLQTLAFKGELVN